MYKKTVVVVGVLLAVCVAAVAARAEEYLIGEEDMLHILVWGNPDLSVRVPVKPDGRVSMPLVGEVTAAGLTTAALKETLERELSQFSRAPSVSVIVTEVNSFKVYLMGDGIEKKAPSGVVMLRRATSLLQLLAQLGSLKGADLNAAYVLRDRQRLPVDFAALVAGTDLSQDIPLRPNDLIVIPETMERRIRVVGAVKTPGLIAFTEGMTALDAVLSAGGFTEFANMNSVLVVRREGTSVKDIEVRLKDVVKRGDVRKNILLQPGDLVTVGATVL